MNRYHLYVRNTNGDPKLVERLDPKGEWVRARDIDDLPPCPECGKGGIASVGTGVGPRILQCFNCNTAFAPVRPEIRLA